jgi:alpha-tubulin suppressor-like RCC1 family protein
MVGLHWVLPAWQTVIEFSRCVHMLVVGFSLNAKQVTMLTTPYFEHRAATKRLEREAAARSACLWAAHRLKWALSTQLWALLLMCGGVQAATIAGGAGHSLQIRNGILYAWGQNSEGQLGDGGTTQRDTPVVVGLPAGVTVTAVAAGGHSLSISSNGNLYAWGKNSSGQLGDGSTTQRNTPVAVSFPAGVSATAIAAGADHSLAIGSNGNLYAWGNNTFGQVGDGSVTQRNAPVLVSLPAGVVPTAIAAGSALSLAIGSDGHLYAWGYNSWGQLGDGSNEQRNAPVLVSLPAGVTPTAIAAGGAHSLAVGSDGKLYGWGKGNSGQVGDGSTFHRNAPVLVSLPAGVTVGALVAGGDHSLALGSDGNLYAWGANAHGELGDGSTVDRSGPVLVNLPAGVTVNAIAAGSGHSLASGPDGALQTWGDNSYGQLGTDKITLRSKPVEISLAAGVTAIAAAAGHDHSLAMGSNGGLYAWGRNDAGQLGNSSPAGSGARTPTRVALNTSPTDATKLAAGFAHSMAIDTIGRPNAWGSLVIGGNSVNPMPTVIILQAGLTPVTKAVAVAAGNSHNLAIGSNGTIYAWGLNTYGVLGDGSVTTRNSPVPISLGAGVSAKAVAAGAASWHSLAIGSNNKLYAWGNGTSGQLGDGAAIERRSPVLVSLPAGVSAIAVAGGANHSLAIGSDGRLYAWGANTHGQLGDGTTTQRNTPWVVSLSPGVTPVSIAAGDAHSLAIGSDGRLYAWGRNDSGQVGDGTTTQRNTPALVSLPAGAAPSSVSAGSAHSLAVCADGKLYGWGTTSYDGVLGDVNVYQRSLPAAVTSYPAPASDMFADRRLISGWSGQANGSNVNAAREPGEPVHDASASGKTVWWKWVAPASGMVRLRVPVKFGTVLAVYAGNAVDTLSLLAASTPAKAPASQIDLAVQGGAEYQIAVDGFGTAPPISGALILDWSFSTAAQTSVGTSVTVAPVDANSGQTPASITFGQVSQAGVTSVSVNTTALDAPPLTANCSPQVAIDISTTAAFVGAATVCLDPAQLGATCAADAALYHWSSGSGWTKLPAPASAPAGLVCGLTTSFSPFAVFAPATVQQAQSLTFGALTAQVIGTAPFGLSATASSGLAVSFDSITPSVCSVSGSTVTLLAVGTCAVGAHQAGNGQFAAAADVYQSFNVLGQPQTIAFTGIGNHSVGEVPFAIVATASSGLAVSFDSITPSVCSVSGSTVTLLAAGTCSVAAHQAGNSTYAAASDVQQSFSVTAQASGEGAGNGDAPLPLWALVLLGGGLLAIAPRPATR